MLVFNLKHNVGKVKYLISFHNGEKKHGDGSPFFDVQTFSSKRKADSFMKELKSKGYTEN